MGRADVRLAGVFGDHMVLQRGVAAPVRGWAEPGETVPVHFGGQTVSATAAGDGAWIANKLYGRNGLPAAPFRTDNW
jgi:sialate O-acetylesterase